MPALQVFKNGKVAFSSEKPGLKPLAQLYFRKPKLLEGAYVYDKVVGEASARIMVLAKVHEVHAGIASRGALEKLQRAGTVARAEQEVELILNDDRTDRCPMEKLSIAHPSDPAFLKALKSKFRKPARKGRKK